MRIAIIGAGNVGGGLARAAVAAGHDVVLSAAHQATARTTAQGSGARAAESNVAAVQGAEVVVLAEPGVIAPAVAAELAPVIDGAVVVDATNASNETYSDLALNATNGWAWQSAWQLVGPTA